MQLGEMTADDVFSVCQRYADQHKHKLYVFGDLRRALADDRDAMSKIANYLANCKQDGKDVSFQASYNLACFTSINRYLVHRLLDKLPRIVLLLEHLRHRRCFFQGQS